MSNESKSLKTPEPVRKTIKVFGGAVFGLLVCGGAVGLLALSTYGAYEATFWFLTEQLGMVPKPGKEGTVGTISILVALSSLAGAGFGGFLAFESVAE